MTSAIFDVRPAARRALFRPGAPTAISCTCSPSTACLWPAGADLPLAS